MSLQSHKSVLKKFNAPVFFALFVISALTSCDNKQERQQSLDDLKTYVRQHRDSVDMYATQTWDRVDSGFETRKAKLDKEVAKMDTSMQNDYNQTLADWQSFQNDYNRIQAEKEKLGAMDSLRSSLALSGVRPDFTDVTADNILQQYEHFVSVVKANKDAYTKQQWTVVNVSYKSLNGRKREIEKDLHKGDEAKIVKLQLEYTGIKAVNRPLADNE